MDSITNNFHISQEIYFPDTQLESPGRTERAIKSLIRKQVEAIGIMFLLLLLMLNRLDKELSPKGSCINKSERL